MEDSRNIIKAIDALTLKAGGEVVDSKNITEAIDNLKAVYDQEAIGIDKTLTQEGLAADAKAVGDSIQSLSSSIEFSRFDVTTTDDFQVIYQFSHYITKKVAHIACRLKVLSTPTDSDPHVVILPSNIKIARVGLVIPAYKSTGEWTVPNQIIYCYVGESFFVIHPSDIVAGNFILFDYVSEIV